MKILLLLIPMVALADSANLSWTPPTQRVDGAQLPASEISGYVIRQDDVVIAEGVSGSSYTVNGLVPGTYCYDIATVDSEGRQGPFSSPVVCGTIKALPGAPTTLDINIVP